MREVPVSRLPLGIPLRQALLHRSGRKLHEPGETLTRKHIALMRKAGIEHACLLEPLDRLARFEAELKTRLVYSHGLKKDERLARAVYAKDGRLILDVGAAIDEAAIGSLMLNEIEQVRVAKSPRELALEEVSEYRRLLHEHVEGDRPFAGPGADSHEAALRGYLRARSRVRGVLSAAGETLALPREGRSLAGAVSPRAGRDHLPAITPTMRALHRAMVSNVEALLELAALSEPLIPADLDAVVDCCLRAFERDRAAFCRLSAEVTAQSESRAVHTVHVMALSLAQAWALGLTVEAARLLLYAAMLHDFGMEQVPEELVNKPDKLSEEEMALVRQHVVFGLEIADRIEALDKAVALGVYQSHEEPAGAGYPQGLKGERTHEIARLLRGSTLFSAMTAPRPHRKPRLAYQAMEAVLRRAAAGQCDLAGARGLVRGFGLYPIGSWVELSDHSQGVVLDTGGEKGERPLVEVRATAGVPVANPRIVDCAEAGSPRPQLPIAPPPGFRSGATTGASK